MPSLHGAVRPQKPGKRVGAVVARLRPPLLEAAVDVPAEVVEGRRDDGDGEDVLHRRRHDVLASRNTRLVRHEADVDQPHDHDRQEVELLGQDLRVERCLSWSALICSSTVSASTNTDEIIRRPPQGRSGLRCANLRNGSRGVPCPEAPRLPPPCGGFLHTGAGVSGAVTSPVLASTRKTSTLVGAPSGSDLQERHAPVRRARDPALDEAHLRAVGRERDLLSARSRLPAFATPPDGSARRTPRT